MQCPLFALADSLAFVNRRGSIERIWSNNDFAPFLR